MRHWSGHHMERECVPGQYCGWVTACHVSKPEVRGHRSLDVAELYMCHSKGHVQKQLFCFNWRTL